VVCANPGEVMGRFGEPSFGLYDTASGVFQFEEIGSKQITTKATK